MLHRSELVGIHGMLGFHESRSRSNSGGSGNASVGSKNKSMDHINGPSDSKQSSAGLGEGHIGSSSVASALEQGQALQNGKESYNKINSTVILTMLILTML